MCRGRARNAAAEKELNNLRTHSEKQMQELEAIRANVPELEHKVKASRDEVVVVEKQRRNAEVALAAAIAARTKAEEDKDAAEKRVATSMFEIQALAGQLVEEQSAKTGLSAQLSSASETNSRSFLLSRREFDRRPATGRYSAPARRANRSETICCSSSGANGFTRYASAPSPSPLWRSCSEPSVETMTRGIRW